jgi:hypothetical protein
MSIRRLRPGLSLGLFTKTLVGPTQLFQHILINIFYQVYCTLFYIENDAEIFPVHYTWKVAEKGFKMPFMMNKLTMIISCVIILEK